ncbi:MAG: hypothetical protein ABI604_19250 [Nitrospirota bacterium]
MGERESLLRFSVIEHPCLSWDTFCDLLDAVPWNAVEPRLPLFSHADKASGDSSSLREQLAGPGQYFFEANLAQQAFEIFWLKLSLFDRLCRQVAQIHAQTRRPILTLDPAHILITLPEQGSSYVPVRWGCRLTVQSPDEAPHLLVDDMPPEMASGLSPALQDVDRCYVSPSVREWPLGREVAATALIQSADPIPEESETSIRGLIRVHVIADGIAAQAFSRHDVFRLVLPLKMKKGTDVRVWARKVDVPERGIVLSGVTDVLSPEIWKTFKGASGHAMSDARAVVYRSFPPSSDLYGLGMLLLRALLGSDVHRWERVTATLPSLLEGLAPAVQGVEPSDFSVLHVRIRERLCEWQDLFLQPHIIDDLWWDALTLALRSLSIIPAFSYAVPLSPEASVSDSSAVDVLSQEVAHLARRARVELFEADERDRTIRAACDHMLADLGVG